MPFSTPHLAWFWTQVAAAANSSSNQQQPQNNSGSGPAVYPSNFVGPLPPGAVRGPYTADLHSPEIAAPLDPNHKSSNADVVGNGQCVTACSKFSGVTGDTSQWKATPTVADNSDIKPGTAIATFDSNGRYPTGADKNSGSIWARQRTEAFGFWISGRRTPSAMLHLTHLSRGR